jgi:hypothetical protein
MNEQREQLRSITAGVRSRVSGKLGDIWWAFMLRGVFAGLLGICALIWPTLNRSSGARRCSANRSLEKERAGATARQPDADRERGANPASAPRLPHY